MSGSSGNSGGSFEPALNCASISFNTDVNSPQEAALADLNVEDKLDVVLSDNKVVVRRQDTGDVLGTINWSLITKLIECLEEGNEYDAIVRSIQDGLIKIHVSAK